MSSMAPSISSANIDLAAALRDQPRGALVADVDPEPAQGDAEPMAQPDQEVDVGDPPDPPGERATQLDAAEIDYREPFADLRQAAGVAVAEWRRGASRQSRLDGVRDIAALLLGSGRDARHGLSVPRGNGHGVPDREDLGMPGYGEIGRDREPPGAVGWSPQPLRRARGAHAGGPDDGLGFQPVAAIDDAVGVAVGHGLAEHDLDTDALERFVCIAGEIVRK